MRLAARATAKVALATSFLLASSFAFAAPSTTPEAVSSAVKPAEVSFQFERMGVPVPRYTLRVNEDGTGSYEADEVQSPADKDSVQYSSPKHIDRTLKLTAPTVTKIFNAARDLGHFDLTCETKSKHIANTGVKTLSYRGADGAGSCTYNYSDNREVNALTDTFLFIAYTLDEGRRLEFLHRYDRLGLDEEMNGLVQAVKAGHALELDTIAPVLTAIAGDGAVMLRVRSQAARLLEQAESNKI